MSNITCLDCCKGCNGFVNNEFLILILLIPLIIHFINWVKNKINEVDNS